MSRWLERSVWLAAADQRQAGQRLLEGPVIGAGRFISDPLNRPLRGPLEQGGKARCRVGELADVAAWVSMGIEMLFGDVDADGL